MTITDAPRTIYGNNCISPTSTPPFEIKYDECLPFHECMHKGEFKKLKVRKEVQQPEDNQSENSN